MGAFFSKCSFRRTQTKKNFEMVSLGGSVKKYIYICFCKWRIFLEYHFCLFGEKWPRERLLIATPTLLSFAIFNWEYFGDINQYSLKSQNNPVPWISIILLFHVFCVFIKQGEPRLWIYEQFKCSRHTCSQIPTF